ncbi:MAG: hypothetical protein COA57_14870 [Flavobacteriales bacterium]|nr:MAG: hypothetical protein COA57_14870 [Flavobacteriales bacterium]
MPHGLKNIRNRTMSTDMGKDVKNTSQISGLSKPNKSDGESNETVQYVKSGKGFDGPYGGRNTNS